MTPDQKRAVIELRKNWLFYNPQEMTADFTTKYFWQKTLSNKTVKT